MKTIALSILSGIVMASNVWAANPTTVVSVNGKQILANSAGLTAYTFDPDQGSVSTCYGGCAKAWPPILLPSGETVVSPLGVTQRTDGTQQIIYDGHPIYLFSGDQKSGDTNGDGLDGVWHVIDVQN